MSRIIFAFLFVLLSAPSWADETVRNYWGTDHTTNYVNLYDNNGNVIDASWGNIVQFAADGPIYWNGDASDCGWAPGSAAGTPWCGIKSYKCQNGSGGPDLLNCTYQGVLFDPAPWQTSLANCQSVVTQFTGCWEAPMVYNVANNNYVLWMIFQDFRNPSTSVDIAYSFTCTTPVGPCTLVGAATVANGPIGSFQLFVDDDGTGYVIYNRVFAGGGSGDFAVFIDRLNSTYTAGNGTSHSLGINNVEAPFIFKHGSTYYPSWGSLCADCPAGSTVSTVPCTDLVSTCTATSGVITLNADGCRSQPMKVTKVVAGGQPSWIYEGMRFNNRNANNNHGESARYFHPLSFVGDVVQPWTCAPTVTIPGITASTYPTPPPSPVRPAADQSDIANAFFGEQWGVQPDSTGVQLLQTFTPSSAPLYGIGLAIGKGTVCSPGLSCSSLDPGTITVDLVTLDGSNNPVTILASQSYASAIEKWVSTFRTVVFNQTLTPGTPYGIRMKAASGGSGTYWASPQATNTTSPYSGGILRQSTNGGSTWSTLSSNSLMFATFPTPALTGGGRLIK